MSSGRDESTSAVTGRIMCNARSRSLLSRERVSKSTEAIPPVGNHPLLTASTKSPRATARSGITRRAAVAHVSKRSGSRPRRSELHIPSGRAIAQASSAGDSRHGREEFARSFIPRLLQYSFRWTVLHDAAAIHYGDLISKMSCHDQVMRNEQIRHPQSALQLYQEIGDLRLH